MLLLDRLAKFGPSNILYSTIILLSLCITTLTIVLWKVSIKTIGYTLDKLKFYSFPLGIKYNWLSFYLIRISPSDIYLFAKYLNIFCAIGSTFLISG